MMDKDWPGLPLYSYIKQLIISSQISWSISHYNLQFIIHHLMNYLTETKHCESHCLMGKWSLPQHRCIKIQLPLVCMKSGIQKISIPLDWDKQQILKHNEHMRCSLKWELISWWKQVHNFVSKIETCSRLTSIEWMEMLIRTSFCAFAGLQFASLSLFIYPWRAQRSFNCTK